MHVVYEHRTGKTVSFGIQAIYRILQWFGIFRPSYKLASKTSLFVLVFEAKNVEICVNALWFALLLILEI
jgi:hypothetical protein